MKKFAFIIDLLCVLLFVAIGRDAHQHGISLNGMASTAWPFAAGLVAGWLLLRLAHRKATTRSSGFLIVLAVVILGMVLRIISGQGTALTFILVAMVFLSLFLVGWRTAFIFVSRRSNGNN